MTERPAPFVSANLISSCHEEATFRCIDGISSKRSQCLVGNEGLWIKKESLPGVTSRGAERTEVVGVPSYSTHLRTSHTTQLHVTPGIDFRRTHQKWFRVVRFPPGDGSRLGETRRLPRPRPPCLDGSFDGSSRWRRVNTIQTC